MVPDGWSRYQLNSLGGKGKPVVKAGPFGSALKKGSYTSNGFKVYGQEQVIAQNPYSGTYYIDERKYASLISCRTKPGDVLMSLVGTIGRVLIIPDDAEPGVINPRLLRISPSRKLLRPEYFKYVVQEKGTQNLLARWAQGGTMGVLNAEIVGKLPLLLPPITEQDRIIKILSTWDQAIETIEKLIKNSKAQKKALMQQLLTGKKRLPGFNDEWNQYRLERLCSERKESNRLDLPLLSITQNRGVIYRDDVGRKDTSSKDKTKYKRLCPDDIGYNTMRMWQGVSALSDKEGIISPAYTVVTPKQDVHPRYMAYLFKLPKTVHDFYRHSQGLVSDTWNLKFPNFSEIKVTIPALHEQEAIAGILQSGDCEIEKLTEHLENLRRQKKALMQQLLTGKRRVKVAA